MTNSQMVNQGAADMKDLRLPDLWQNIFYRFVRNDIIRYGYF